MKKWKYFVLLMLITGRLVFSFNIGILKGILKPESIAVLENEAFILERATVYVFSLNNLQLIREFGREGQGPGEIEITPWLSNTLNVSNNSIVVDSVNKLVIFSKEGKLIGEKRRSAQFTQAVPARENLVVRKRVESIKDKLQYSTINVFNTQSQETKELYRQKLAGQLNEVDMIPDSIHFQVYEDKILIEESPKGFFIEVFNSRGEKLYKISKNYKKIPVTRLDKKEVEELLSQDSFIKMQPGGWEQIKKQWKINTLDSFPAIQDIVVADNKIYVQTFKKQLEREEYIIMDLKGNELKRVFLPAVRKASFTEQMMGTGVKLFCISQNKFYYIVEKDEWCELHAEVIVKE